MPVAHRKLRRKDLKEPDEFLSFFNDLREFLTTNLQSIVISAAVVAGVGLIVIATYYYEVHRDHLAASQFYAGFQALDAKQYKAAADDFSALSADDSGREIGRLARFYLASAYLGENDLPHARDALIAYLAEAHDAGFEGLALMDLATVYEELGDLKKAEGAYQQAAAIPGAQGSGAELGIARMRARLGDPAGAIDSYREFLDAHPFAPERQEVIEALAQLGASPPALSPAAMAGSAAKLDQP
jgi:predicted negative regulator of RcsB-dependent stress response